jgi:transposase
VAQWIEARFGIHYHRDHVCRLLHALGFSPQKPARRAVERDETAIADWIQQQWPAIKKKRPA